MRARDAHFKEIHLSAARSQRARWLLDQMNTTSFMPQQLVNEGFDRLQRLLLAMRTGDELRPAEASQLTGLTEQMCMVVLNRLTTAGLMSLEPDGRFVRRTMDPLAS
jgi:hypothetical protein